MDMRHDVLLAVIGDVHASWRLLDRVLERAVAARVHGILLVGDLGSHDLAHVARRTPERDARYLASIEILFERIASCGVPFAFVPGNHDLPELAHERNADGRVLDVAGLRVAGIGGAGPQRFGFAYEWGEDEIRASATCSSCTRRQRVPISICWRRATSTSVPKRSASALWRTTACWCAGTSTSRRVPSNWAAACA